eukprot:gnl/Spiro4/18074_TR9655_c0_g1_i1.p1 gnl/Spiro4/18074_TR9655_c0_g1~~gnl/Spiro4/18074_TR9655_c0_g1_i1.p1  ORF type:complete len:206 (+),score=4.74 gnl/Spiro4/18074_TR9655_c0_g1_i1:145-762(+)
MAKTFNQLREELQRTAKMIAQSAAAGNRHASLPHTQDVRAIKRYQSDSSGINRGLIKGNTRGYEPHIRDLSNAITNHSEPTTRDMHVYHGFEPDSDAEVKLNIPNLPKNDAGHHVLKNPAFLSTSLSRVGAQGFGQDLIKIHIPKGSKVGVPKPDNYSHEKEVILHRGHELHIHPTPTRVDTNEGSYNIWHAKLIHDGTNPCTLR